MYVPPGMETHSGSIDDLCLLQQADRPTVAKRNATKCTALKKNLFLFRIVNSFVESLSLPLFLRLHMKGSLD
jgi:hypothetical protein